MKKFLLLFTSILSFSLLPVTNKAYAQEVKYPNFIMKTSYNYHTLVQENVNTYEFFVYYYVYNVRIETIAENEYFLVNDIGINFRKGTNRNTNSYELIEVSAPPMVQYSIVGLRITITRSYANDNYNYFENPNNISLLFSNDTALYILYQSNTGSIDYNSGYADGYEKGRNDGYNAGYDNGYDTGYDVGYFNGVNSGFNQGYNDGYNTGYDIGYNDGINASQPEIYQQGFEDGRKSTLTRFIDNFHVWFIPAIIIVFAIGVFVSYKKGRDE